MDIRGSGKKKRERERDPQITVCATSESLSREEHFQSFKCREECRDVYERRNERYEPIENSHIAITQIYTRDKFSRGERDRSVEERVSGEKKKTVRNVRHESRSTGIYRDTYPARGSLSYRTLTRDTLHGSVLVSLLSLSLSLANQKLKVTRK